MENKQISNEILIAGIEIRTTFINGKHFKDIGKLWQKVMSHNELQKIPCTKDKSLYCIYYDYENEDKGEYSVMIGMEVSNIQEMPQNFKIMRIIPGKYRTYQTKTQDPTEVQKIWQNVWNTPKTELHRTFKTDFDHYTDKQVFVFIGNL
ncbi:hypothetical protein GCL60_11255 [Silvanigrella paludirubra]|uniref:AraC effector-binding domain-containing protein n=1 Tax=Silvanigrella paludirubra TaxID=2499159 RepID=A0A6N6VRP6_9BACT|nr:effector binding domain-containing protein [Silvanigrella paludirubra]KAB8037743.1 hypothetical protein GCL60_11255 [Silvanigrella paludirubra]